jgi:hypothetical protein
MGSHPPPLSDESYGKDRLSSSAIPSLQDRASLELRLQIHKHTDREFTHDMNVDMTETRMKESEDMVIPVEEKSDRELEALKLPSSIDNEPSSASGPVLMKRRDPRMAALPKNLAETQLGYCEATSWSFPHPSTSHDLPSEVLDDGTQSLTHDPLKPLRACMLTNCYASTSECH